MCIRDRCKSEIDSDASFFKHVRREKRSANQRKRHVLCRRFSLRRLGYFVFSASLNLWDCFSIETW